MNKTDELCALSYAAFLKKWDVYLKENWPTLPKVVTDTLAVVAYPMFVYGVSFGMEYTISEINKDDKFKLQCDWCDLPLTATYFADSSGTYCSEVCQRDSRMRAEPSPNIAPSDDNTEWPELFG